MERNSQTLETGEGRFSFPMKSKDASREKEKVRLKVQDKAEFAQFEEFVEFLV